MHRITCSTYCTCIFLSHPVGVHNLMSIVAALLSDISVLILSSSYTALTFTVQAIWSLLFPLKITYVLHIEGPLYSLHYQLVYM